VAEEEIDLAAMDAELIALAQQVEAETRQQNAFLEELALPPLP
jgi:type I restriction enzyme M protein